MYKTRTYIPKSNEQSVMLNCFELKQPVQQTKEDSFSKEINYTIPQTKSQVPTWVSLCDRGHQYLFSNDYLDWNSAREMCKLLGGYIVRIDNRHENNCILDYAMPNEMHDWWWTSGTYYKFLLMSCSRPNSSKSG